jgi:hypothetical protein
MRIQEADEDIMRTVAGRAVRRVSFAIPGFEGTGEEWWTHRVGDTRLWYECVTDSPTIDEEWWLELEECLARRIMELEAQPK